MFRKTKLSSAVVIALATTVSATMLTGLTGCKLTEGGTSITGGQTSTITNPKGTVVGNVQDTNGNPLASVWVYLAGKKVKTDMGGNYRFNSVPVTNATGTGDDTANGVLSVSIVPDAGYLGATVTVNPEAQFNNNGDNGGGSINPVTTFVDGFIAQAGTAVLPALTATSSGVLRNNVTGEPLANQEISLDMVATSTGVAQEQVQNGVATSYATYNYTTTTDTDGNFTFTGLPDDSTLNVVVPMYAVNTVSANAVAANQLNTVNEGSEIWHGNVFVTLVTALDTKTPYVTAVVEVTSAASDPGSLHDDVTNTLTVNFSETMNSAMVDANSVRVIDYSTNTWLTATATMAADGKSMTVVSTTDFVAGNEIHVHMLLADFQDMAGNTITEDSAATTAPASTIAYDYLGGTAAGGNDTTTDSYLELQVMQYAEANGDAQSVTNLTQDTTDTSGTDDDAMYQAASNAFNDTEDGAAGIQQVNSQDDDDNINAADAADRLAELLTEQGGSGTVAVDVARISFTPSNAAYYVMDVTSGGVKDSAATVNGNVTNASAELDWDTTVVNQFTVTGATGDVAVTLASASIDDVVTITPYDDFGYAGTATSVTIADNVKPRTILQSSYGENLGTDHDGVVVPTFGDGGELSQIGSENVGVPYIAISAGLLDNLDTNGDAVAGTAASHDNALTEELMAHNEVDSTTTASGCDVTPCTIDKADGVYDATAWTVFSAALARTVGISMSEDVSVTGTPATTGITVGLSNWTASNDVTVQDGGGDPGVGVTYTTVDMVQVDAADVIALANADANGVIDFATVISDEAGNTADAATAAKVVIRDAMPPMVASATYNGGTFTVTFNEDIAPAVGDTIVFGGTTLTVTQDVVDAHTDAAAADKDVLVIDMKDLGVTAGGDSGLYADMTLASTIDYATAYGATPVRHFSIDFSAIEDASADNNSWDNENAGVTAPMFAGTTTVDPAFTIPDPTAPTASGVATQSITFTATHPIDTEANFGAAANDLALTEAQLNAAGFDYNNGGTLASTDDCALTGTLNAARNTLTLTVNLAAGACGDTTTAADVFVIGTATSDYDSGLTANPADVTLQ